MRSNFNCGCRGSIISTNSRYIGWAAIICLPRTLRCTTCLLSTTFEIISPHGYLHVLAHWITAANLSRAFHLKAASVAHRPMCQRSYNLPQDYDWPRFLLLASFPILLPEARGAFRLLRFIVSCSSNWHPSTPRSCQEGEMIFRGLRVNSAEQGSVRHARSKGFPNVCTKSPGRQDSYAKIPDSAPTEEFSGQCAWNYFGIVPGLSAI